MPATTRRASWLRLATLVVGSGFALGLALAVLGAATLVLIWSVTP